MSSTSLLPFVAPAILTVFLVKRNRRIHPSLPPGPPADPIIGHVRKVPIEGMDRAFYELRKTYGDVVYVEMLGQPIIVLNSVEAAVDLLEKRSVNYSDRPPFKVFELMGWTHTVSFVGYGKPFQRYRRRFQEYLKSKRAAAYRPMQVQEGRLLLQNLLKNECDLDKWLRRFTTSVIMRVTYGHRITRDDDVYFEMMEEISHSLGNAGPPGNTPVDLFPILAYMPSWFPGAYYGAYARKQSRVIIESHDIPFENVRKEMAAGTAKPSLLVKMLEKLKPEEADDKETLLEIRGTAGVMYCAAMTLHPECQKRAQEEIDRVIGSDRLPDFSDRDSLPYVQCVLQEVMRWNPVVPLGIPHRSLDDDVYRGMFIPKGSLVFGNARAMGLDENVYQNAEAFEPSRFLPSPLGRNEPPLNGPFGFGRRICPGRHLADASIWIVIASVLATFDIKKAPGPDGKEITPEITLSSGITSQPSAFECRIRPRHERAKHLIVHADVSLDD
ncbi:hypothetical protein H0H93_001985 [Arthromyces matolae]|nr:hypothetical protein H0H93_001985 [Arthromyces matolae]